MPRLVFGPCLALVLIAASAAPASAQLVPGRIPPVVFDVRGFWPGLGQDPVTASDLDLLATDLPSRGLGAVTGVHVYPIRRGRFALGAGGELIVARGNRDPIVVEGSEAPVGPTVHQRLQGFSAQVSLNFGNEDGWSYLTGGMGPMRFGTYTGDTAPAEAAPSKSTINLGGGARWFFKRHLAFTFDVRFYLTRPEVRTELYPGRGRSRLLVLSAGIAIK
ncbi:MAG: hypothetical protein R2752_15605 [Vicinamibacterales bacterium]